MSDRTFTITVSEETAKIICRACDLYGRLQIGQLDKLIWELIGAKKEAEPVSEMLFRQNVARRFLEGAKYALFPDLAAGSYYGVRQVPQAELAFDVHQALRVHFGDQREVIYWGKEPHPVVTVSAAIEEVE